MRKCIICGCNDMKACEGGCYWISDNICSKCFTKEINRIIELSPKICPITKLPFVGLVISDDKQEITPVYSSNPNISYSLPWYSEKENIFYRSIYSEDEEIWITEAQELISLDTLKANLMKEEFEVIKKYYKI